MPRTLCAAAAALVLLVLLVAGAAPAGATTVTLGPTVYNTSNPNGYACAGGGGGCVISTYVQTALAVPGVLTAPADGTIVGWRVRGAGTLNLRVMHGTGAGFVGSATSTAATAVDGSLVATSLPIAAGDSIGVDVHGGVGSSSIIGNGELGSSVRYFLGGLPDNAAPQAGATSNSITMFLNADVVLAVPAISALAPASGPAAGGTAVTITGQHLLGTTAVTFGSTPAAISSVTNTQIVAVAPPGSGTVGVTVTAPGGTSAPAQYTYPTPAPPPLPVIDKTAPVVQDLIVSPKRFVAANTGPAIAARVGTRALVRVSEASTLTFRVARRTSGVKKGKRCLARTPKRHGRSCKRYVTLKGSFTKAVTAGTNLFRIQGRLRGRTLSPGTYRLSVTARDAAGNVSKVKTATFTIVRQ